MSVSITKEYVNHVSFESCSKAHGDPYYQACENADISNWEEYCALTCTFTIKAYSEEELDEKTLTLISDVEHKALNKVIEVNFNDGETEVTGFDLSTLLNPNIEIEENRLEFTDEDTGTDMVLFFNNWNNVFGEMSEEDRKIYAEDYPLNKEAVKYGLDDQDAYGNITILTKSVASEFFDFS